MAPLPQDRLVRKEVALGLIREFEPPQDHLGLRLLAPFQGVQSDDVIFSYTRGLTAGLAPARAEDAESEMAGKDESVGTGRAALIDWAIKDHYDPSDVTRYREALVMGGIASAQSLPLALNGNMIDEWQTKLARDARRRRRLLDNRLEWLIMTSLETGGISYNDGKILFTVDFGRPAGQTNAAPASGSLWSVPATADPIGDLLSVKYFMRDTYGVTMDRAIISQRVYRNLRTSERFVNSLIGSNPLYTVTGWGDQAASELVQRQADINFIVYDSVYRTRPLGSNTVTNNRFLSDNKVYLLPSAADVAALDDAIGFGKTLTSPHPEGNWQTSYYEWERSTVDPWGYDVGTGIKMFPVFPHLDLTYTITVL